MTGEIPLVVVAFKTVTLVLGGLITYFAAKAALKSRSRELAYLAIGFGTVTSGSLLAGVADQLLGLDARAALAFENAVTMVGFAVVAYSLYVASQSSLVGR
ncbi:hypothetical protein EGH21_08360 [Halomicroarcula sp. F13]|uniref:Uncharacterized protein n=1 Tax=Haloarcula rubra TaxID=2487747 RepID=A0AAW4PPA9_9EURY|nr:hypothetical protein [Halomicroarcula rubra]MBX0323036.1 hypothetical protein [Halomicroarcula rubra]